MAKTRRTVLAADRHGRIPSPELDAILEGELLCFEDVEPSGWFLVTSIGFGSLAVPWDAATFRGVAIGALTGGLAAGMGNAVAQAGVQALGEAIGSDAVESAEKQRLRTALHGKNTFAAPNVCLVEVALTTSTWSIPRLDLAVVDDDGTRRTKTVMLKTKPASAAQVAEALAMGRVTCEAQALWKRTAAECVRQPDHPALDLTKPLTQEALEAVTSAGLTCGTCPTRPRPATASWPGTSPPSRKRLSCSSICCANPFRHRPLPGRRAGTGGGSAPGTRVPRVPTGIPVTGRSSLRTPHPAMPILACRKPFGLRYAAWMCPSTRTGPSTSRIAVSGPVPLCSRSAV